MLYASKAIEDDLADKRRKETDDIMASLIGERDSLKEEVG